MLRSTESTFMMPGAASAPFLTLATYESPLTSSFEMRILAMITYWKQFAKTGNPDVEGVFQ